MGVSLFQSTPPRGGRPAAASRPGQRTGISIHAPARGATDRIGNRDVWRADFNPRPREGGDDMAGAEITVMLDFNPRPREGGDFPAAASRTLCRNFNPRPREGGDRGNLCVNIKKTAISIHAPARGATITWTTITPFCRHFNPRPREGGDLSAPWIA